MGDEEKNCEIWIDQYSNDYIDTMASYEIDSENITISGSTDGWIDFDQWYKKEQNNNITLNGGGEEMLRVAPDGFYVRGVRVETDDKEAKHVYEAFKQWLTWNTLATKQCIKEKDQLAKEEVLKFSGVVEEVLGNSMFRVKLENNHEVTAYIGGKLRMHTIKIIMGDKVDIEMSPYDLSKARIIYRRQ